jgi:hypothetical protein
MTQLGSEEVTHQQWYRGVMLELLRDLGLLGKVDIKAHWQTWETLPPVQQLQLLIDEILTHSPRHPAVHSGGRDRQRPQPGVSGQRLLRLYSRLPRAAPVPGRLPAIDLGLVRGGHAVGL